MPQAAYHLPFQVWYHLNIAVDGSEDLKIYCFKKGETCEAGAEQLQMQLSVLDEPNLPNPFMEIDDSDTEEENEMNIKDNDSDVDSDIDVEDQLKDRFFHFVLIVNS